MIQLYEKKEDCCGCGACVNACPKNAISMQPDEQGFLYPVIKHNLCIECGICKKNCQIGRSKEVQYNNSSVCYAVKNTDSVRVFSSSGGIFSAIMDKFFIGGGVCCWCLI